MDNRLRLLASAAAVHGLHARQKLASWLSMIGLAWLWMPIAAGGGTVAEWRMDDASGPLQDSAGNHPCTVSGLRYGRKPLFSGSAFDFSGASSLPTTSNASHLYVQNLSP